MRGRQCTSSGASLSASSSCATVHSPPGLGQPSGHVNEVQGAHGTLVRLLNGDEFESPRVELATTLVVGDSTARLG